jgi:hypothetical protein
VLRGTIISYHSFIDARIRVQVAKWVCAMLTNFRTMTVDRCHNRCVGSGCFGVAVRLPSSVASLKMFMKEPPYTRTQQVGSMGGLRLHSSVIVVTATTTATATTTTATTTTTTTTTTTLRDSVLCCRS